MLSRLRYSRNTSNRSEVCVKIFLSADVDSSGTSKSARWPRRERKALMSIICAFGRDLCGLNQVEIAGRKEKWYGGKTHGTEGLKWEVRNFCRAGGIRMGNGLIWMLVEVFGRVANLLKL